jgi:cytidine deaminase
MTDRPAPNPGADLQALLANAHAPYSGVRVACAVRTDDGALHFGVNVENAAYPEGLCAEAGAIAAAVTAGSRTLTQVYLASSLPGPIWPCGGCRQKIFEFAAPGCEIITLDGERETGRRTIAQLLPLGFRLDAEGLGPG